MEGRTIALTGSLLMIGLLAFLTFDVIATSGIDVLVVISLLIIALFAVGVVGALLNPPEE